MTVGNKYRAVHARSLSDPEGFWAEQAAAIDWSSVGTRCSMALIRPSIAGSRAAN